MQRTQRPRVESITEAMSSETRSPWNKEVEAWLVRKPWSLVVGLREQR